MRAFCRQVQPSKRVADMQALRRRRLLSSICVGAAAMAAHATAWPQVSAPFPQRPVKLVVPYPAGGVVDVTARAVTEALSSQWGQPVIVENKPGANGNLGADTVRLAKPDGYTLLAGSMFTVINPLTDSSTRFKTSDFQPVAAMGATPNLWVVPANSRFHSLTDFIAQARQKPGVFNVANPGHGSSNHLGIERLTAEANIELTHIHYQGQPPFIADLVNGRLDIAPVTAALALPHVQSGKLKVLAVIGHARLAAIADTPTLSELGYPEAVVVPWNGIMAPAGTPPHIVHAIASAVAQAQHSPQVLSRYAVLQAQAPAPQPAFSELVNQEVTRWSSFLRPDALLQQSAALGK